MSRPLSQATLRALELVRQGTPAAKAASECGIERSTLWRALKVERCQCCGQVIANRDKSRA